MSAETEQKMTVEEAAAKYAEACQDTKDFAEKHKEILATYEVFQREEATAEALLREVAKEALTPGATVSYFGIPISRIIRRTYDIKALLAKFPHARQIKGLVKEVLDVKTLDGCVKAGILNADEVATCKTVTLSDYAQVG